MGKPRQLTMEHSMMRFGGETALVTGAVYGIGAAIARRLSEGARVIALDRQVCPWAEVDSSVKQVIVDVSAPEVSRIVAQALGDRALDYSINNAGIGQSKAIAETTDEDWDRFLRINLAAPFQLIRDLLTASIHAAGPSST